MTCPTRRRFRQYGMATGAALSVPLAARRLWNRPAGQVTVSASAARMESIRPGKRWSRSSLRNDM